MSKKYSYLFKIVDSAIDAEIHKEDESLDISCKAGCAHCCYFLVETVWDEAMVMARAIAKLPNPKKDLLISKIHQSAKLKREFFGQKNKFSKPTASSTEIPDKYFDKFFLEHSFPCPILDLETNQCSMYEVRPTSCRFHMVTSPSDNCMPKNFHKDDYEVPTGVENAKDRLEDEILSYQEDERWGELSLILSEALRAL